MLSAFQQQGGAVLENLYVNLHFHPWWRKASISLMSLPTRTTCGPCWLHVAAAERWF